MQIHMMFDLLLFCAVLCFFRIFCLFVEVFVFGGCTGRTRIAWHVYLQIYLGFDFCDMASVFPLEYLFACKQICLLLYVLPLF